MEKDKKIVGVTGGIGAGKSVVSRVLRCEGFMVYDCDYEARLLMDASDSLKTDIASRLGADCITPEGELHRPRIADCVFADPELLQWLNSQVHTLVKEDIDRKIRESQLPLFFVESAILHSSGIDSICHEIWMVDAPEELRLQRAMEREGVSPDKVLARMKAQKSEFDGIDNSKVRVIRNDGDHPLLPQINALLGKLPN